MDGYIGNGMSMQLDMDLMEYCLKMWMAIGRGRSIRLDMDLMEYRLERWMAIGRGRLNVDGTGWMQDGDERMPM